MSLKGYVKNVLRQGVQMCTTWTEEELRDRRNVDIVLSAALEPSVLSSIQDPVAYVAFLRSCIEPNRHSVQVLKADTDSGDIAAKRFTTLVQELRGGLPVIPLSVAREIAGIADQNRFCSTSKEAVEWAGDVGLHFSISSSFGNKGRILFSIVRLARSERCLELGTAYGMSALFILAALNAYATSGYLVTVEGAEPQFSLSSSMLSRRFGEAVSCQFGDMSKLLPDLVKSVGRIDFMFHDAEHSEESYVRDFNHVSEILAPGAVVLFDDIRWENPRFTRGKAHTYKGWQTVVGHSRVKQAVEIDDSLGLLLMG